MLETHLPLFYRTFVPDKILEHFITLAALVQKHLIIRHRVTNNSNCLAGNGQGVHTRCAAPDQGIHGQCVRTHCAADYTATF